jgi:hypothetical protein
VPHAGTGISVLLSRPESVYTSGSRSAPVCTPPQTRAIGPGDEAGSPMRSYSERLLGQRVRCPTTHLAEGASRPTRSVAGPVHRRAQRRGPAARVRRLLLRPSRSHGRRRRPPRSNRAESVSLQFHAPLHQCPDWRQPPVPWDGTSQMPEKGGAALAAQKWVRKLALNFGMDIEAVAPWRRRFFRAPFGTDFRDCGSLDFRPCEPCPETYPFRDRPQRPRWITRYSYKVSN